MATLLIDGYNLIPTIPPLGRLIRRNVKKAREALIDLLSSYVHADPSSPAILVVFDGEPAAEETGAFFETGVEIRYSGGETADDLILKLLRKKQRGAALVTSDRALRNAAEPYATELIRSGAFSKMIQMRLEGFEAQENHTDRELSDRNKEKPESGNSSSGTGKGIQVEPSQ